LILAFWASIIIGHMEEIKATRETRQKDFVRNFLSITRIHPTAYQVVQEAKRKGVRVSVTTAYRILNQMVKLGDAVSLSGDDGQVHYDAVRNDHIHFVCRNCGSIKDVFLSQEEIVKFGQNLNLCIDHIQEVVAYGICDDCLSKNN